MSRSRRLLRETPILYLGPDALSALEGGQGLLLGARRPGWVDLLVYKPLSGRDWRQTVAGRLDWTGEWDAVGIVLSRAELERARPRLERDLIPGDVVLAAEPECGNARAYIHRGDRLTIATLKVSRRRRSATSSRPGRPPRCSRSS